MLYEPWIESVLSEDDYDVETQRIEVSRVRRSWFRWSRLALRQWLGDGGHWSPM